jgi:hypothetical protein
MFGWSITASLPFRFEAGQHRLRVHARLDDLDGDPAFHRFGLRRQPDCPHTAFADGLDEPVFPGDDDSGGANLSHRPVV